MFEILFLAFAITVLLRWPEDVRRMRERNFNREPLLHPAFVERRRTPGCQGEAVYLQEGIMGLS